jgi:hypothetical protein
MFTTANHRFLRLLYNACISSRNKFSRTLPKHKVNVFNFIYCIHTNYNIRQVFFCQGNHRFLRLLYNACISSRNKFSRTLPKHKVNVFNFIYCIHTNYNIRQVFFYHLFEGICFGRHRRVAVLHA